MQTDLPAGFEGLQPFVSKWALATEYERAKERRYSSPEEIQSFYDAALFHLPEILKRVDLYPLGEIEGADRCLFRLALSLAEVAPHVEFYGNNPDVPFAFEEARLVGRHCDVPD